MSKASTPKSKEKAKKELPPCPKLPLTREQFPMIWAMLGVATPARGETTTSQAEARAADRQERFETLLQQISGYLKEGIIPNARFVDIKFGVSSRIDEVVRHAVSEPFVYGKWDKLPEPVREASDLARVEWHTFEGRVKALDKIVQKHGIGGNEIVVAIRKLHDELRPLVHALTILKEATVKQSAATGENPTRPAVPISANTLKISKVVTEVFEKVEPQFLKDQIARYRAFAKSVTDNYIEAIRTCDLNAPKAKLPLQNPFIKETKAAEKILTENRFVYDLHKKLEVYRSIVEVNGYVPNYVAAEQAAKDYVESAKRHFIQKMSLKIGNACGDRPATDLSGALALDSGVVAGRMNVVAEDSDSFVMEMSVITNYRDGNPYAQYPARFSTAKIKGNTVHPDSEEWMAEHFGGKPLPKFVEVTDRRRNNARMEGLKDGRRGISKIHGWAVLEARKYPPELKAIYEQGHADGSLQR